ncbi:LysR family transcriptional regulator [Pelotomaculum propionicicum]|uniref:HTH-type transcriptional regulator CysL n=1 Tax=Pelotomaculum propionicicum TaxID=258475 RepID=A0A4Y7RRS3_9FIRM|nr:LysR family transcriptional regulator [Pelotomaculum propionicicum]TEB11695.1 HTH-type transcriptional regulator CysL [Pelotomaculum propionicicum]
MRTELLKYFVKVVQYGSINQAARELFMAQSSLSEAILSLEKEIGCQLLQRSKKGVIPTTAGSQVYQDALQVISLIDNWREFSVANSEYQRDLNFLATPSFCSTILKDLMLDLQEGYPQLKIFLHEEKQQNILKVFKKDPHNIAINFYLPHQAEAVKTIIDSNHWTFISLFEDYAQVVLSSKNPLAGKEYLLKNDLQTLSLAQYSDSHDQLSSLYFRKFFKKEPIFFLGSKMNILQMIINDQAAGIFSRMMMKEEPYYKMGLLKLLPIKDYSVLIRYYCVYNAQELSPRLAETIIEKLKQAVVKRQKEC